MSKQQRDEFLAAASQLADELGVLDDGLAVSEVKALLRETGADPDALLGRFHRAVKDLESTLWANGKTPPLYLRRLVGRTAAPGSLPADHAGALAKVKEWLERFREGATLSLLPAEREVLRAYRKDGALSDNDVALLDDLEQTLKAGLSGIKNDD